MLLIVLVVTPTMWGKGQKMEENLLSSTARLEAFLGILNNAL